MSKHNSSEPMLEMFVFETTQHIDQLETLILNSEKAQSLNADAINEIFRIMHTIKGSSAMMQFCEISDVAHSIEDLFYLLREHTSADINYTLLSDLVLTGIDFIKEELDKVKEGIKPDGQAKDLVQGIREYLDGLKASHPQQQSNSRAKSSEAQQYSTSQNKKTSRTGTSSYKAVLYFDDDSEMENIRAYTVVHNLKDIAEVTYYLPEDIIENDDSANIIRAQGFQIFFDTEHSLEEIQKLMGQTVFLKDFELIEQTNNLELGDLFCPQGTMDKLAVIGEDKAGKEPLVKEINEIHRLTQQSIINVNVEKIDKLMDLVGELTIAEAMVTQNPDLRGMELDNFQKAARQLQKICCELQDVVMTIRMVPLAGTFRKMQRIVRDMSKKLGKEVQLEIIGEATEVDKNIIDHISDPLMHLVRNAIDHGSETDAERQGLGKAIPSVVTLEAKGSGSDVLIVVRDDGKGLNKEKILERAKIQGLLTKESEEMSDAEVFNLIFLPGFSTKDNVTEFSGRGVGLDVVLKNLEEVGGTVLVDSLPNAGTTVTMKIPLTLAIIDGMNIRVGNSNYTLPTSSIKEFFRPKEIDIISDPDDNEMIMVRGQCYPIKRLHKLYNLKTQVMKFSDGILIMVEHEHKALCLFADELLGQQQVVVKSLPGYIKNLKKINGLAGCTLLGNGKISLILDIGEFFA